MTSGTSLDVLDRGEDTGTVARDTTARRLEDEAELLVGGRGRRHGEKVAVLVLVRRYHDLPGIEALDARLVVADTRTGRRGDARRVDVDARDAVLVEHHVHA